MQCWGEWAVQSLPTANCRLGLRRGGDPTSRSVPLVLGLSTSGADGRTGTPACRQNSTVPLGEMSPHSTSGAFLCENRWPWDPEHHQGALCLFSKSVFSLRVAPTHTFPEQQQDPGIHLDKSFLFNFIFDKPYNDALVRCQPLPPAHRIGCSQAAALFLWVFATSLQGGTCLRPVGA